MAGTVPQLSIQTSFPTFDIFTDSRTRGFHGASRNVRLPKACASGGGTISKSPDGVSCAVAGKESLRIVRVSDGSETTNPGHKSVFGKGGWRIDASKNFWDGSGLKMDSAQTDVSWAYGVLSNKILTSSRNGELIMWDAQTGKFENRVKHHVRAIQQVSASRIVEHYCITGSADGDLRIYDIRQMQSIMRIHHASPVRSLSFSPSLRQPLQAAVGLDNGSLYRWDLRLGQRGQLDRLPLAHTSAVTSMDWTVAPGDEGGMGWLVTGSLDRTVKVWDLSSPSSNSHIPNKPTYVLHPSFPVRRTRWRPGYECELAIISNAELGAGLDSDMDKTVVSTGTSTLKTPHPTYPSHPVEEAVEIWDVRRGWIAKWSVTTMPGDGGVNDISFPSPHCLWASHHSGTFSQLDLREVTKPLDAIPRVTTTWEASGSLAFVNDKVQDWEIPYDDIPAEKRLSLRSKYTKSIGDAVYEPESQNLGTLNVIPEENIDIFVRLAQGYICEGPDKQAICEANAQVAFDIGKERAAQIWLVVGAALADLTRDASANLIAEPSSVPTPALSGHESPAARPQTDYTFPPKTSPGRSASGPKNPSPMSKRSASSKSASPRHRVNVLPPITPITTRIHMARRESMDSTSLSPTSARRPSIFRRASTSVHHQRSSPSLSISERTASSNSNHSLRHVGEGALDDSDSDSPESGREERQLSIQLESDDERDMNLKPLISSPVLQPTRTVAHPSPLSRVAGQRKWTEDEGSTSKDTKTDAETERDERGSVVQSSSPSPQSTDSETSSHNGSDSPPRFTLHAPRRNSSANKRKRKSRSRSSTLASLAAPPSGKIRGLSHSESQSSIATVIAAEKAARGKRLQQEETIKDLGAARHHQRQKSQTISELVLNGEVELEPAPEDEEPDEIEEELLNFTDRLPEAVFAEERKLRAEVWDALKEALEEFANEGDVQMCSMLSVVASKELKLSHNRVALFLDSYIDILSRMRLHACAAYLRKYCRVEDTGKPTLVETIIYTSCGKCRKPILHPQVPGAPGAYAFCASCRNTVTCAICRLPVRGLLFQCPVCTHGGHQICYRKYYMKRPPSEIPPGLINATPAPARKEEEEDERASTTQATEVSMTGHRCAAGCGHFCWASND